MATLSISNTSGSGSSRSGNARRTNSGRSAGRGNGSRSRSSGRKKQRRVHYSRKMAVVLVAAVVLGVERLHGAAVRCTDLRGGAALCAAALAAEGETSISDITHIDRGYQSIEDDLAALGADIRRVEETASP